MTLIAVSQNQQLGVRYAPLRALTTSHSEHAAIETAEQVLVELGRSGAVVALLPPPAWAVGLYLGPEPLTLAWLTPLPMTVATPRSR